MTALRTVVTFLGIVAASAAVGWGQVSSDLLDKAPPHIDQALRARVAAFYQCHVDGKFRQADQFVHEDSKDAFFMADKSQYKGFEIARINYEADFSRAQVVTVVQTDFMMPPAGRIPVTMPLTTLWKLDAGEWWWYVKPVTEGGVGTPFGDMKPGAGGDPNSPFSKLQHMPGAGDIRALVRISKTDVKLNCAAGDRDEIVVSNGMPGPIKVYLTADEAAGFKTEVEKPALKAREEGKLIFSCEAAPGLAGKTLSALVAIHPTNQQIPLKIHFAGATPESR
jgi:hypothetical protein